MTFEEYNQALATSEVAPGYERWFSSKVRFSPDTIIPVRLTWKSYQQFCIDYGLEVGEAEDFVLMLRYDIAVRDIKLITRDGPGRIRRLIQGIYLLD